MTPLTVALAQINSTVGDLTGNAERILQWSRQAHLAGAQLVVFPELALCGYPPEDLVLKKRFLQDCHAVLQQLAEQLPTDLICITGVPTRQHNQIYNSAAVLQQGCVQHIYSKMLLPNYSVFDEQRHFCAGTTASVLDVGGLHLGLHICEDSWAPDKPPTQLLAASGIDALINLSASPYHRNKRQSREQTLSETARACSAPLLYCNLVGGQDELVFDGASSAFSADGTLIGRGASFKEELLLIPLTATQHTTSIPQSVQCTCLVSPAPTGIMPPPPAIKQPLPPPEEVYTALKTGLRDYVEKNGFNHVVVASSGGIDSALVLTLAVDALGIDRVSSVTMPSQYTSAGTLTDAGQLSANLGIELHTLPIKPLFDSYLEQLAPVFSGTDPNVTEENLQARIRGNLIMALSNKFGWLVLTTGNKSEMATGYCTIYGDMAGGFAVIKDVPKTLVFELCRWRNTLQENPVIPPSIIERPPSAELRPDQKDTDSLPPYSTLDAILQRYVEQDMGVQEITDDGFEPELVKRIIRLVDLNEYKRRQGPPGIKITPKAFGRDRRMPITNRYGELSP